MHPRWLPSLAGFPQGVCARLGGVCTGRGLSCGAFCAALVMGCHRVTKALACVITAFQELISSCRCFEWRNDGLATDLVVQALTVRLWTQSFH